MAALFAGVVVVLELNKGTLTIESDSDDVALKITQGDEVVEKLTVTRGSNNMHIAAGQYVVDIDGKADGITVKNGNVTIERRGAKVVKVVRRNEADMAATKRIEMAVNTTRVLTLKQPIRVPKSMTTILWS